MRRIFMDAKEGGHDWLIFVCLQYRIKIESSRIPHFKACVHVMNLNFSLMYFNEFHLFFTVSVPIMWKLRDLYHIYMLDVPSAQ